MSKSRTNRKRDNQKINELTNALIENGQAKLEGPKKKKWTFHDLKNIKPLTPNQEDMFHAFFNNFHICAYGTAGTGKTLISLYLAFCEIFKHDSDVDHVIIVRSAVPSRELGYMPGDLDEKVSLYEAPYKDICAMLFGKFSTYDDMKSAGIIKFLTTSFVRGLTWDNAIIIIDEGQNMTFHEINSIMTRVGEKSRVIFTGDLLQTDLTKGGASERTGMAKFIDIIKKMKSDFYAVEFTHNDIVRSKFVKSWIIASEKS